MNRGKREKTKLIVLIVCGLLLSYYFYVHIDTHSVMVEIKQIESGEKTADNRYLLSFQPTNIDKHEETFRYFTLCYGKRGKIWIKTKIKNKSSSGREWTNPDWFSLDIEKQNGQWKVIGKNYYL